MEKENLLQCFRVKAVEEISPMQEFLALPDENTSSVMNESEPLEFQEEIDSNTCTPKRYRDFYSSVPHGSKRSTLAPDSKRAAPAVLEQPSEGDKTQRAMHVERDHTTGRSTRAMGRVPTATGGSGKNDDNFYCEDVDEGARFCSNNEVRST